MMRPPRLCRQRLCNWWLRSRSGTALLALLPILLPAPRTVGAYTRWTAADGIAVYAAPALTATILTRLPNNQPLRVTPVDSTWARTTLWNALPAWVPLASLQDRPRAYRAVHASPTPVQPVGPHPLMTLTAHGRLREPAYLRLAPAFSADRLALLHNGAALAIDAWATDGGGAAWYHVAVGGQRGWVYGDAVTMDRALGGASTAPLHGTGMWFTYSLLENSPPSAIVAAARAAGLTHLYVEVARSNAGFYGAPGLAGLLPVAHRAGIHVIAWVYPFLDNLPADVAMSVATAQYVTPSGDRPDGLLADVEENMAEGTVRAYGQILRAILGPRELMAVATYPPQSAPGRTYPFATAALSWNVIVPMDYWHLRLRAYGPDEVYRFVRQSVQLIRAKTRSDEPVEVLGQMYDPYQSGVNNPSAAEIAACAAGARASRAIGLSFFEWNHATPEEWGALATLRGSQ